MKTQLVTALMLLLCAQTTAASEPGLAAELAELRQLIGAMKNDYEARIAHLEERLARAENRAEDAVRDAGEAFEIAEQNALAQSSGVSSASAFNPAIGAVLVGQLADVEGGWESIPGFIPAGEIGTGSSGFALGEAEVNLKAAVDPNFYANLTLSFGSEDGETELGIEEAWMQTTGLPYGMTVRAGRFFSEAGYLNKFHLHADDFADRPLPYQAFFGGQYVADGAQLRWVIPASVLVEVGAEMDWGGGYPSTINGENEPGSWTLFGNVGGDIGLSNSWQLGFSWIATDAVDRESGVPDEAFSGDSDLAAVDFVWKWAPAGNPTLRNFKLQGEYFRRNEDGTFAGMPYDGDQSGWYVQGVWQFMQRWRAGYRYDAVKANNGAPFTGTALDSMGRRSQRSSLMLDWSPSEFSRLRMQYARDSVLPETTRQWVLQYLVSIGAHGAHAF